MRVLVTGSAGFIGFHLARRLLAEGHAVHGYDGFTPYYDVALKESRHALLAAMPGFVGIAGMLEDSDRLAAAWRAAEPDVVVHLAAQAGVRYSLENPRAYVDANLVGTFNLLELARRRPPLHLLIASTSSVYGAGTERPFHEALPADRPLTTYAASKRATELLAHSHAHLFAVPTTAARLFTVYGPWGRPDMAAFKFAAAILSGQPLQVFGEGRMTRDFTFIDDVVEALRRLMDVPPQRGRGLSAADSLSPVAPYRVVNVGGGNPVGLLDFIRQFEVGLGRPAKLELLPMQAGDVPATEASSVLLQALTGFRPTVGVAAGVAAFCRWYVEHYAGGAHDESVSDGSSP